MDCCSNRPKETEKEMKNEQAQKGIQNNGANVHSHGGGCFGGGNTKGMIIHMILMVAIAVAVTYFTR